MPPRCAAGGAGLTGHTALCDLVPVTYLTLDRAGGIRGLNLLTTFRRFCT